MLSGTRDSVASHATAEMPKTMSPNSTHGEVTALIASDRPAWARAVAICMPCLSITCPTAAEPTANSSSAMLAMVKRYLPDMVASLLERSVASCSGGPTGATAWRMPGCMSGSCGSPVSDDFDMHGVLRMRRKPQDVLIAEQGRPEADQRLVDLAGDPELLSVCFGDGPERQSGGLFVKDLEPAGADEPVQGRPGEKAQVRLVQNAAAVIAEQAHGDPRPRVPVREVRNREQHLATWPQHSAHVAQHSVRPRQMLHDVRGDDDVVTVPYLSRDAVFP